MLNKQCVRIFFYLFICATDRIKFVRKPVNLESVLYVHYLFFIVAFGVVAGCELLTILHLAPGHCMATQGREMNLKFTAQQHLLFHVKFDRVNFMLGVCFNCCK